MKKMGESAFIHIPAAILRAANLEIDAIFDVREEAGRIVIEPVFHDEPDLAALSDAITPENLQGEVIL